jgi:hypothetical protein
VLLQFQDRAVSVAVGVAAVQTKHFGQRRVTPLQMMGLQQAEPIQREPSGPFREPH